MATKVVQQEGSEPVDAEVLAQSIKKIADAMDKAVDSRLKSYYSYPMRQRSAKRIRGTCSWRSGIYLKPDKPKAAQK